MNDIIDINLQDEFRVPKWLKYFSVLFTILGLLIPLVVILNFLHYRPQLAIYGLESNSIFTLTGIIVLIIFALKSIVGYGILKGLKWAFNLAIIDAVIGVIICILNFGIIDLVTSNQSVNFEIRLELLIIIPYLIYLLKNKSHWTNKSISK